MDPFDTIDLLADEEVIRRYSHAIEPQSTGMVFASPPPYLDSHREPRTSALGNLDCLPVRILENILQHLDFLSLSRFSAVSFRGEDIVRQLPACRDLTIHCPSTLAALAKMRLLPYHSVATIVSALHSSACAGCGSFAAYLFLFTCERACWTCLHRDSRFWAIPRPDAGRCFKLSHAQLRTLMVARSIPGQYEMGISISRRGVQSLVSVRDARDLALEVHSNGSRTAYRESLTAPRYTPKNVVYWTHLHEHGDSGCESPRTENFSNGMASIMFPVLEDDSVIKPLWCMGCDLAYKYRSTFSYEIIEIVVPEGEDAELWFKEPARREWAPDEFLEHARNCIWVLMAEDGRQE